MDSSAIRPEVIRAFAQRKGVTNTDDTSVAFWSTYMQTNTESEFTVTVDNPLEIESAWLTAQGAGEGTLHDKWITYLNSKGYEGSPGDKLRQFFNS